MDVSLTFLFEIATLIKILANPKTPEGTRLRPSRSSGKVSTSFSEAAITNKQRIYAKAYQRRVRTSWYFVVGSGGGGGGKDLADVTSSELFDYLAAANPVYSTDFAYSVR